MNSRRIIPSTWQSGRGQEGSCWEQEWVQVIAARPWIVWRRPPPTGSSSPSRSTKTTRMACGCSTWAASRSSCRFLSGQGRRDFVATREFFPQTWHSALRQRTRWVTGIALQGWSRFGWRGKPGELYWLWRDRKGQATRLKSAGKRDLCLCRCDWTVETHPAAPGPLEHRHPGVVVDSHVGAHGLYRARLRLVVRPGRPAAERLCQPVERRGQFPRGLSIFDVAAKTRTPGVDEDRTRLSFARGTNESYTQAGRDSSGLGIPD